MTEEGIRKIVDAHAVQMNWHSWEIRSISQHNCPQAVEIDGVGWLVELRIRLTDPALLALRREGLLNSGADDKFIEELPEYVETDAGLVIEESTGHVVTI